jgi:hypothetical protein
LGADIQIRGLLVSMSFIAEAIVAIGGAPFFLTPRRVLSPVDGVARTGLSAGLRMRRGAADKP